MLNVEELNIQIRKSLDKVYIVYEIDEDGDFYITSGIEFPLWVSVVSESFIKIFTFAKFNENVADEDANRLLNSIGSTFFPNSCYQKDGRLNACYYLPVMDGFSERTFIEMLRRCSSSFISSIRQCDVDDLIA